MPVLFVHGVAVRHTNNSQEGNPAQKALIREMMTGLPGVDAQKVAVFHPYWGLHGVPVPASGFRSLPRPKASEWFGTESNDEVPPDLQLPEPDQEFVTVALRQTLVEAVDIIWSGCAGGVPEGELKAWAKLGMHASDYAQQNPRPSWLAEIRSNYDFLRRLTVAVNEHAKGELTPHNSPVEWFGVTDGATALLRWISAGLRGVIDRARHLASTHLVRYGRRRMHDAVALFFGDVFTYLNTRGSPESPGPIVRTLLDAMNEGAAAVQPGDPHLIILAHSLGGVIVYDILTHFLGHGFTPPLLLVTVGSQVGLFQEMRLFSAPLRDGLPGGVRAWWNVYDPVDVFGFIAHPIFGSVEDFPYPNRTGVLSAHSAYFLQPGFFSLVHNQLLKAFTLKQEGDNGDTPG